MKIDSIKIKNFRGYKDETKIELNDLTVFVGKNDIGKSTILEALDIFFNDGKGVIKLDKTDVNVKSRTEENLDIEISVCFSELPEQIVIDSTVETSLQDEFMLNANGQLEVIKRYKNGGSAKVFIKAKHPTNDKCAELLLKKNRDLKRIIQSENIECENQTVNAEMRKAIWNKFSDDLQQDIIEIDVSKEDAKKIWEKLSNYLPTYSLFQSDRKNSDGDNEIQDPLKTAVKQILSDTELQATLAEVAVEVENKLKEVADRTLTKLREMDSTIAASLNPIIPSADSLKWQDVFKNVSISGDEDIPINKRGSGVKRLVLLNFFRAEAERRCEEQGSTGVIYAIEEPETSQHSDNQRIMIEAFKTLASAANTQIILTTHSSYIVKQLQFTDLRLIKENEEGNKEILGVLPGQLQYPSLNEVNYIAFNEVTEEYHDELYSFIEFQGWKDLYIEGKPTRLYKRIRRNGSISDEQKVLTEYIRHQIHHPENQNNPRYTREELKQSIDLMRVFIEEKRTDGVVEP